MIRKMFRMLGDSVIATLTGAQKVDMRTCYLVARNAAYGLVTVPTPTPTP